MSGEDTCDLIVDDPSRRNCAVQYPFLTDLRGLASYSTYGSTWLRPNSFMAARWVKVTGQLNF